MSDAPTAGHARRRVARGAKGSRDRVPHANGVLLGARVRGARALHLLFRLGRIRGLAGERAPGVLWVVLTFSALLGLQRSFGLEEHDRGIDALLVSPISRESIYLGKAIGNLLFLVRDSGRHDSRAGAILQPARGPAAADRLRASCVLAMIGIVAVGTLFSAMAVNTRLAELLLPMLSLPFFVPILMNAAQASTRVLAGRPLSESWPWLKILIAFDLVFVVACTLAFPFTLEE